MSRKLSIAILLLFMLALTLTVVQAQPVAPRALPFDIVINSSFEPDASFWTVKNTDGKDKVKCGGVGHTATNCAFRLKGSAGEKTKLEQTYTVNAPTTGSQYLFVTAHVRPLAGGQTMKFYAKIKRGALSTLKISQTYTASASSLNYTSVEFESGAVDVSQVTAVKFGVKNSSLSGATYVDEWFVGFGNVVR
ncbi:MAG: hypothetical protein IPM16_16755 [Chloroflexi bacterium]|nr:hypothetical protein [Chloroflexota bacterium]